MRKQFVPTDNRTVFCKDWIIPYAVVEVIERGKYLTKVRFPNSPETDLVSPAFLRNSHVAVKKFLEELSEKK